MDDKIFTLNGRNINSITEFHDEVRNVLCPAFKRYGRSWNAFNDVLRGGFGSFELGEKITIIFKNKKYVKKRLGEGFLKKVAKFAEIHDNVEIIFE
ncbi:MAG: barstar family protein [Candidatus Heimdallarchaeota archaeon]